MRLAQVALAVQASLRHQCASTRHLVHLEATATRRLLQAPSLAHLLSEPVMPALARGLCWRQLSSTLATRGVCNTLRLPPVQPLLAPMSMPALARGSCWRWFVTTAAKGACNQLRKAQPCRFQRRLNYSLPPWETAAPHRCAFCSSKVSRTHHVTSYIFLYKQSELCFFFKIQAKQSMHKKASPAS